MSFAEYKFFSWARKGIAANITEKDTLGKTDGTQTERAIVPINITLNTTIAVPQKNFTLVGPGDIIGIQPDMIIRSEPRDGVSNFEPNYFPYIEFYDEDFPWRYTPASGGGNAGMSLRPWISLILLKEDEFEDTTLQSPLKSIVVKNMGALQPADELHLWAHMHSNLNNDETNFEKYIESLAVQVKQIRMECIAGYFVQGNWMQMLCIMPSWSLLSKQGGWLAWVSRLPASLLRKPHGMRD